MAVGILAEYNPMHNGHIYQINKVKELFPKEEIIVVLCGNWTQRGDPSIIDKWSKTKLALTYGVDLVIELPTIFVTQSADYYAYGYVKLLNLLKVKYLVFGSESDNIDTLKTIAQCQINNKDFDILVKMYSKLGNNYPTAISKAVYDLTNKKIDTPNDLLGISYIKEIIRNNYNITPISIKRENDYHSLEIDKISSASAIRMALKENKNIKESIPSEVYKIINSNCIHFIDDYFDILKYKIITEKDLTKYLDVCEGIDNKLKKEIINSNTYNELINNVKSKRWTYNKIKRILLHILLDIKNEEKDKLNDIEYIRILGFNDIGKRYLNKIKKNIEVPIISKFVRNNALLELELKITSIYSIPHKEIHLIKDEYINHLN